jgi:flagellar basal-body rod modification protein FlgD
MSVQTVTNTVATNTATSTSSTKSTTSMGKDDFLKILMAQLKNQDPLNPQDPSQFVSELSQLSSVESLKNIESSLGTLNTTYATGTTGQWLSSIGSYMQVDSTTLSQGDKISLTPSGSYDSLKLTLRNTTDGTLKTVTFKAGETSVFANENGSNYSIVGATKTSGDVSTSCDYTVYRVIRGVQSTSSGTLLVAGDTSTYTPATTKMIFK